LSKILSPQRESNCLKTRDKLDRDLLLRRNIDGNDLRPLGDKELKFRSVGVSNHSTSPGNVLPGDLPHQGKLTHRSPPNTFAARTHTLRIEPRPLEPFWAR